MHVLLPVLRSSNHEWERTRRNRFSVPTVHNLLTCFLHALDKLCGHYMYCGLNSERVASKFAGCQGYQSSVFGVDDRSK